MSLCRVMPVDIVQLINTFLRGHPGHHFFHRCTTMCARCGVCVRQWYPASSFAHKFIQARFTSLVQQTIVAFTRSRNENIQLKESLRDVLRVLHYRIRILYLDYLDKRGVGWILTHTLISGHLSVACSSECLQVEIGLIQSRASLEWQPFVRRTDDHVIIKRASHTRSRREQIVSAEKRAWQRILLRHRSAVANIICNDIFGCHDVYLCQLMINAIHCDNLPLQLSIIEQMQCTGAQKLSLEGVFDVQVTQTQNIDYTFWESSL